MKAHGTRQKDPRRIPRWDYADVLAPMPQRRAPPPERRLKRKALIAHPVGTIKRGMAQSPFLMRGKKHVSTAMRLRVLAYNIKRGLNILGVKTRIEPLA